MRDNILSWIVLLKIIEIFLFVPPHSTWPARLEKQIGIGCLRRDCCNKYWTVGHDRQSCYKKRSPHQKVYLHLLPLTRNMLHNEHDDPLPYGTVLSLFSLTVWRDNDQTWIESSDVSGREEARIVLPYFFPFLHHHWSPWLTWLEAPIISRLRSICFSRLALSYAQTLQTKISSLKNDDFFKIKK